MSRFTDAKISIDNQNYDAFFSALAYYDRAVEDGQRYLESLDHHSQVFSQTLIVDVQRKIPGMMSHFFQMAQEADGIKNYVADKANAIKIKHMKRFKENYNRELTDRMAEKYSEGENDYLVMREMVGEINLRVDMLSAVTKGIDALSWQIRSLIELRKLGIEDAVL